MNPWAATVCGTAGAKGIPCGENPSQEWEMEIWKELIQQKIYSEEPCEIVVSAGWNILKSHLDVWNKFYQKIKEKLISPFSRRPSAACHFHVPGKLSPGNVWCVQDWNKFGLVENGGNFRWCLWKNGLGEPGREVYGAFPCKECTEVLTKCECVRAADPAQGNWGIHSSNS